MTDISTFTGTAVRARVAAHLQVADDELDALPVVTAQFPRWQHVNVQAAFDHLAADPSATLEVRGVPVQGIHPPTLAELLLAPDVDFGPLHYDGRAAGVDVIKPSIGSGLLFFGLPGSRVVAWVRTLDQVSQVAVEVKADSLDGAQRFVAELRRHMAEANVYRGQSLRVHLDSARNVTQISFAPRPTVSREELVLPAGVLDAIDAHAVGIGREAARLRAAGRHLKRGLLLYGPPGTGKTLTVKYIASRLPEATLFVLTGGDMFAMKTIAELLAELAPAVVVLDDIDLVAEDRSSAGNAGSALFDLLDAMDGMREDLDVLFVCTSNRANALEEAIAARPGRIDQAIEISPPDAGCRARLIELYGAGLDLRLDDLDAVIARTEGVTASFVKELMRRATVLALADEGDDDGSPPVVRDAHVHAALDRLLDPEHPLFRALLGVHDATTVSTSRGVGDAWCGI